MSGVLQWKSWKQAFKNLSLKKKLLLFYCVLFLLPLCMISVIIYVEVSREMTEKLQYSASQGYEQAKSYLEYKVLQLIQRTDAIAVNHSLKESISGKNASVDRHRQLALRSEVINYLQSLGSSTQNISLRIYIADELEQMADDSFIHFLSEADASQWYGKKGARRIYFAPDVYLEEEMRGKYISMIRDIPEENDYRQRNCVLRMDIGLGELEEILRNATPTEHAVTYLVNRENVVVCASDQENLAGLGLAGELPEAFRYSRYIWKKDLAEMSLYQDSVYCIRNKIRNTDWEMVTVIPKSDMTGGIIRLQYIVVGLMLCFCLLAVIGGTVLISWIVRRISHLNESFNQVKRGDTKVYLPNDTRDEIGLLYDNYNDMMRHTNRLMDEKYQMGIHLKSAELKALQSQINPHFLYNTLDLVNWLAYSGRTEDIHRAVVSLSKYYRLILNKGEDTLTLAEELQHVGYYIKIQDIRFPGKLTYIQDVEEGILDSMVPKIILQPLVENALQHGIWEKKEKRGTIRIWGYLEGDIACVKVIDDGIGMDEQTLCHVMDGTLAGTGSSYGVRNVHARLQLMFGEQYGLTYESKEGEGTCVTVRFPRKERGQGVQ